MYSQYIIKGLVFSAVFVAVTAPGNTESYQVSQITLLPPIMTLTNFYNSQHT